MDVDRICQLSPVVTFTAGVPYTMPATLHSGAEVKVNGNVSWLVQLIVQSFTAAARGDETLGMEVRERH